MKKIGAGLQFNVYDLGNEKVLKTFRTKPQMYLTNLLWEPYLIFAPWILSKKINQAVKDREFSLDYFKRNNHRNLLANLEINDGWVFQDKITPIIKIIGADFNYDKEIIDKYFNFIIQCWKKGFSDKVYNFTLNNGINKKGNIVLIDFGEITTNKEDVERAVIFKRWKDAECYRWRIHGNTKRYYKQKMEELLTLENLNKYWKRKEFFEK